jgi:hypothetical protein
MTWFEDLTGFSEINLQQVRANLRIDGNTLSSQMNHKVYICGLLETPTLVELRERVRSCKPFAGPMFLRELIADVRDLLVDPGNAGALFQVASQFNLLEMVGPDISPEQGVGIYENDRTQGPACAIAAGAGTIYRNYFAPVDGEIGQSEHHQINCLADLGAALGNSNGRLWEMKNGYALATPDGLAEIAQRLHASPEETVDDFRQTLRIGLQWNTQVTLAGCQHLVSQAYCSALPVGYSHQPQHHWKEFALLVLEAAYEATFCAAILNASQNGTNKLFLTLLGGGAFGNDIDWILAAMQRALTLYKDYDLDVSIVSFRSSNLQVQNYVSNWQIQR